MAINRIGIATAATLAALGVVAALAVGSGGAGEVSGQPAAAPALEVRTETIHRTVRVRRQSSAPETSSSSSPGPAPAPARDAGPALAAAPVVASLAGHDDDRGRGGFDRDDSGRDDSHRDDHGDDDSGRHGSGHDDD